jgi:hypothetical protein
MRRRITCPRPPVALSLVAMTLAACATPEAPVPAPVAVATATAPAAAPPPPPREVVDRARRIETALALTRAGDWAAARPMFEALLVDDPTAADLVATATGAAFLARDPASAVRFAEGAADSADDPRRTAFLALTRQVAGDDAGAAESRERTVALWRRSTDREVRGFTEFEIDRLRFGALEARVFECMELRGRLPSRFRFEFIETAAGQPPRLAFLITVGSHGLLEADWRRANPNAPERVFHVDVYHADGRRGLIATTPLMRPEQVSYPDSRAIVARFLADQRVIDQSRHPGVDWLAATAC